MGPSVPIRGRDPGELCHVRPRGEGSHLEARNRVLRRNRLCQHPDPRCTASGLCGNNCLLSGPPACGALSQSLADQDAVGAAVTNAYTCGNSFGTGDGQGLLEKRRRHRPFSEAFEKEEQETCCWETGAKVTRGQELGCIVLSVLRKVELVSKETGYSAGQVWPASPYGSR